jgi:hypothetical protein
VYSNFDLKALEQATLGWSHQRKQVVIDIGLPGTLQLGKVKKSSRHFTEWLLKRVDTEKSELRIGVKETVAIVENEFGPMLRIRSGGTKIVKRGAERPTTDQIKLVRELLGMPKYKFGITVSELIGKLQESVDDPMIETQIMQTKVAYTMLVCAVFFSPRSSKKNIHGDAYEMVMEPDLISELNFHKYVYDELLLGAKKVQLGGMLGR